MNAQVAARLAFSEAFREGSNSILLSSPCPPIRPPSQADLLSRPSTSDTGRLMGLQNSAELLIKLGTVSW